VHVVSIELVPIRFGTYGFQSKEVKGAQNSLSFLRLSLNSTEALSLISQIFNVYPDVAIKSRVLLLLDIFKFYLIRNE